MSGYNTRQNRLQRRAVSDASGERSDAAAESRKISEEKPQNDHHFRYVCHCRRFADNTDSNEMMTVM